MEHRVRLHLERLADVVLDELRLRVDVLAAAGGQVVDDGHVVAARDERVDEMGADEARSTGDDRPHAPYRSPGACS